MNSEGRLPISREEYAQQTDVVLDISTTGCIRAPEHPRHWQSGDGQAPVESLAGDMSADGQHVSSAAPESTSSREAWTAPLKQIRETRNNKNAIFRKWPIIFSLIYRLYVRNVKIKLAA